MKAFCPRGAYYPRFPYASYSYSYFLFGTVAELYTRLKREAANVGLVVNASKTKYMLVGGTEHDRIRLGSNVTIDGDRVSRHLGGGYYIRLLSTITQSILSQLT